MRQLASRPRITSTQVVHKLNEVAKHKGLEIKECKPYGLCLFTQRDFAIGDIVIDEESPAIIARDGNLLSCVKEIVRGGPEMASHLDFFQTVPVAEATKHPIICQHVNMIARQMGAAGDDLDPAFLLELASAVVLNSHLINDDDAGLYPVASKSAHSCSPNVFNLPASPDKLKLVAMKPIPKGQQILFPYITNKTLAWPRRFRQDKLFKDRGFLCMCSRCQGVDDVRPLRCTNGACGGPVLQSFPSEEYRCTACGKVHDASTLPLKEERSLEDRTMALELADPSRVDPDEVLSLYTKCRAILGDEHWTVFMLGHILLEMSFMGLPLRNKQEVARLFTQWVHKHLASANPVAAATILTWFVKKNMVDVKDAACRAVLADLLPFLSLRWGQQDVDVQLWKQLLAQHAKQP